jgi:hypothetical protein
LFLSNVFLFLQHQAQNFIVWKSTNICNYL